MKRKHPGRVILILVLAAALTGGGIFGAIRAAKSRAGEVNVYPVSALSTDASWMSGSQTEGIVSADRIQAIYLSDTQQITEIYVEEGQTVRAGEPILAFDTTLSELELERQAIQVRQLELDIQNEEDRLEEIGTYRVGSSSGYTPTVPTPSYTPVPDMPYDRAPEATGTMSDPLIWLWNDGCVLNEAFFRHAAAMAAVNRERAREEREEPAETEPPPETDTPAETEPPPETLPPAETVPPDEIPPAETDVPSSPEALEGEDDAGAAEVPDPDRLMARSADAHRLYSETEPDVEYEMEPDELDDPAVFIVLEVRSGDAVNGDLERVYELMLYWDDETEDWDTRMILPSYDPGDADISYDDGSDYVIDTNVYYTAAEIAQMKAESTQKLKDLRIELKSAELEYERLQYELSSGEVLSRIDGVVKTVRDPDEARSGQTPVVLISGGGGYYVTAVLGELDLGTVQVGDSVTAMSWESGLQMEGVITEISEYPDESGQFWFYSEGNQNVSAYPFKVFIQEDAALREGEYVTVSLSGEGDAGGLYLEAPFVRQEGGRSYVYTVGTDGLLEKRFIRTGQNLWGSYIEILDGLTPEDYVAFPYGRRTAEGAAVRFAEAEELWTGLYGIG